MKIVTPTVHVIGQTNFNEEALDCYLKNIGADQYHVDETAAPGEQLVEAAGRMCYKAWQPGLNPNVTKIREGNMAYMANILKSGHGSILEHVNVTLLIENCSRIFTHEQVRHRAGWAYSQESLRYVRLTELSMYIPDCIRADPVASDRFVQSVLRAEEDQRWLAEHFGIDQMTDFHRKKELTSAFRRIAPMGVATQMIMTGNIRALRHCIALRTSGGAEEEIILIYREIAHCMSMMFPSFFQDMTIGAADLSPVTFTYDKV